MATRLSSLLIRSLISDICIQVATRALAVASSVASAIFAVSIITMVPDFLISYYNICGFNNEISRNQIDERKRILVDQLLKYLLESHDKTSMTYINIVNEDKGTHYISPLITPEYIYNLCILNFINKYPEKKITIGFNGIDPIAHYELSTEYITSLTENSAGQRIDLLANRNSTTNTNADTTISATDNTTVKYNNNSKNFIINDTDIYWLCLGIIFLIMSIILGVNVKTRFHIFMYAILMLTSLLCFSYWFIFVKPQIIRAKKEWLFYPN